MAYGPGPWGWPTYPIGWPPTPFAEGRIHYVGVSVLRRLIEAAQNVLPAKDEDCPSHMASLETMIAEAKRAIGDDIED